MVVVLVNFPNAAFAGILTLTLIGRGLVEAIEGVGEFDQDAVIGLLRVELGRAHLDRLDLVTGADDEGVAVRVDVNGVIGDTLKLDVAAIFGESTDNGDLIANGDISLSIGKDIDTISFWELGSALGIGGLILDVEGTVDLTGNVASHTIKGLLVDVMGFNAAIHIEFL